MSRRPYCICRKKRPGSLGPGRHPAMPDVGDEEHHVARHAERRDRATTLVEDRAVLVGFGREQSRCVASRDESRRAGIDRAVLQQDMTSDHEDRVWDPVVPGDALGTGNVRAGVDVPRIADIERRLLPRGLVPPRGVGDDVAVLTEERLDDLENAGMGDHSLRGGRRVSAPRSGNRRSRSRWFPRCGARAGWSSNSSMSSAPEFGDLVLRNQPRNHREPLAFQVHARLRRRFRAEPELPPRLR